MCVICLKPAGAVMPSETDIRLMFNANPDGAGFMVSRLDSDTVEYSKGYMDVDSLIDALRRIDDLTGAAVAVHFRIATSGGVSAATCHPFEVSRKESKLRSCSGTARAALMHNGILDCVVPEKKLSDTMVFTAHVVAPLASAFDYAVKKFSRGEAGEVVANLIGDSRVLVMFGHGDYARYGRWYEFGDCLVSNMNFLAYRGNAYGAYRGNEFPVWAACNDCPMYEYCSECGPECETLNEAAYMSVYDYDGYGLEVVD